MSGCCPACPSQSYCKETRIFCPPLRFCNSFINWIWLKSDEIEAVLPLSSHFSSPNKACMMRTYFFCLFLVKRMNFALCGTSWWIKTSPQAYALPPGLLVLSPVVMLYLLQESTPATAHFLGWRRSNFCQKNYKNSILLNPCSDFHHEWPLGMKIPVNFIGSKKLYILFENQKRGKKKCYGTIKSFLRNPLFMFALGVSAALIWILSYWMPCMTFYRRWSNCFWKSYS